MIDRETKNDGLRNRMGRMRRVSYLRRSQLLNETWYLAQYPEASGYPGGAAAHYLELGWKQNYDPSPEFSTQLYLYLYPDVEQSAIAPLLHYELHGRKEGRRYGIGQHQAEHSQVVTSDLEKRLTRLEEALDKASLANEITATNTAAFSQYEGAFAGKEVMIVAAGPTMKYYEPIKDAIHIGVNSVFLRKDLKLDFYFTQDHKDSDREFVGKLHDLGCPLFFGSLASSSNNFTAPSESLRQRLNAQRYLVSPSPCSRIAVDICNNPLMDFYSIAFPALHFALYGNPKRIWLVGCDTTSTGHYDGEQKKDTLDELLQYQKYMLIGYRRVLEFAQDWYPETEIISINPVNLWGLFPSVFTEPSCKTIEDAPENRELITGSFTDEAIERFTLSHVLKPLDTSQNHNLASK